MWHIYQIFAEGGEGTVTRNIHPDFPYEPLNCIIRLPDAITGAKGDGERIRRILQSLFFPQTDKRTGVTIKNIRITYLGCHTVTQLKDIGTIL